MLYACPETGPENRCEEQLTHKFTKLVMPQEEREPEM